MDQDDNAHIVALVAVRQVADGMSYQNQATIALDLPRWTTLLARPSPKPDLSKVVQVIDFFVRIATDNSLQNTPAVQKLQAALHVLSTINVSHLERTAWTERQVQSAEQIHLAQTPREYFHQLAKADVRNACFLLLHEAQFEVPIFNIWDSISLIYTLCVEPIFNDLVAELHLFQFRTIVQSLTQHWYFKNITPTTAVGTWSRGGVDSSGNDHGRRVTIAFATSCSGNVQEKRAMASARMTFALQLVPKLEIIKIESAMVIARYHPGNCPEWLTVIIVCRQVGQYASLCQTLVGDYIYKCCGYCESILQALEKMQIHVSDLWNISYLGQGAPEDVSPKDGFSFRVLMPYNRIQVNFNHVNGVQALT